MIGSVSVTGGGNLKVTGSVGGYDFVTTFSLKDYPEIRVTNTNIHVDGVRHTKLGEICFTVHYGGGCGGYRQMDQCVEMAKYPEVLEKLAELGGKELARVADKIPVISKVVEKKLRGEKINGMLSQVTQEKEPMKAEEKVTAKSRVRVLNKVRS